jgi:ADP-ribose pyrophosphatase
MGGGADKVSTPLFLYGTLCHAPLREVVLGLGHLVREAALPGYRVHWAKGGDYPVILPGAGRAAGLLVEGLDEGARARADLFELGFGYTLREVTVELEGQGAVAALAYMPGDAVLPGAAWDLAAWAEQWGAIWVAAAREALAGDHDAAALARRWPMMKLRAATRLRAARAPGHALRADLSAARDVEVIRERHPYTEFFALEDHDLRFRRFDGTMSAPVRRAGFIGGDAASVLPWDPDLDAVLVLEQFRTGPFLRGDPRPWTLEPIAGRIDPGESVEAALRREAREEAGLRLGRLHHVADYYPSPGAVSEYLFSYVGEARLSGRGGEIGGLDHEDEDIRAHVIPFERLMTLIASGEAGTGPLVLTAFWLAANRERLRR